ncbi:MAG: phosphatase PAP2 family protein [Planctomycetes bacterium]|nr:phosphatase PAP2 family protein [Planctomycetota bacterium]
MRLPCVSAAVVTMGCVLAGCSESSQQVRSEAMGLRVVAKQRAAARMQTSQQAAPTDGERLLADLQRQGAALCIVRSDRGDGLTLLPAIIFSAGDDTQTAAGETASETANAGNSSPGQDQGAWWQKSLAGRSAGEVLKDDVRLFPKELWKATKDSVNVPSLVLLAGAGGLSAISRGSWDHHVDESFHRASQSNIFKKEGDFSSVAGNPTLHFGIALTAYGLSLKTGDDKTYAFSKSLIQALTLNGLTTTGLKLAANDHSPNGEDLAWPSGHTSSTATMAAVVWEYYGWQAGVPLYLLTGWVATGRLDDREHWLSDVIFGAVLGSVIGHSVAQGRMIEVGGFTVVPYVAPEGGGGILFARDF